MIAVGLSHWTGKFKKDYYNKDWVRIKAAKLFGGERDPKQRGGEKFIPCCLTRFLRGVFC